MHMPPPGMARNSGTHLDQTTDQPFHMPTRSVEIFERLGTLIEPDEVRKELEGLPA
jgi:hypothetical protein